jgi:hypothetical protein
MAELLQAPNFDISNLTALSYLGLDITAGQNSATLLNTDSFTPNTGYVLYDEGQNAEAFFNGSISGEVVNLASPGAFALNHRHGCAVKQLFGNTVQFWRAAALSDNTPPPIANFSLLGSAAITPDQLTTSFLDSTGGAGFWYLFLYYNSQSGNSTTTDNAVPVRGGGYGNYCALSDIVLKAGLDPFKVDISKVATARAAAQSEVKGALSSAGYIMPLQTGQGVFYVPDHAAEIVRLLAAGMLLFDVYSTSKPSAAKDGLAKMDEARQMIVKIQLEDTMLLDFNEQPMAKPALVGGLPDQNTCPPQATMDKIF